MAWCGSRFVGAALALNLATCWPTTFSVNVDYSNQTNNWPQFPSSRYVRTFNANTIIFDHFIISYTYKYKVEVILNWQECSSVWLCLTNSFFITRRFIWGLTWHVNSMISKLTSWMDMVRDAHRAQEYWAKEAMKAVSAIVSYGPDHRRGITAADYGCVDGTVGSRASECGWLLCAWPLDHVMSTTVGTSKTFDLGQTCQENLQGHKKACQAQICGQEWPSHLMVFGTPTTMQLVDQWITGHFCFTQVTTFCRIPGKWKEKCLFSIESQTKQVLPFG